MTAVSPHGPPSPTLLLSHQPMPCQNPIDPCPPAPESYVARALVLDVLCGARPCTPSILSQLRASGGKLSLASLAVLAPAPHSTVGADGGAPAVQTDAPDSVVLADGDVPAAHDP